MANSTTTEIDTGSLQIGQCEHEDGLLTAAGPATFKKGMILARDSVSLKYVVFVKGGNTNENGIPKGVLPSEHVAAGAGDLPVRPIISGVVNKDRLVIHADGDASNVDAKVVDQLRDYKITAQDVRQTAGALPEVEDS